MVFFFKIRQQKRLRITWSKRHASFIKFPSLVPFTKQRRRRVVPSENVKIYFKTYVVLLKSLKLFVQRHLYIIINTNLHYVHETPARYLYSFIKYFTCLVPIRTHNSTPLVLKRLIQLCCFICQLQCIAHLSLLCFHWAWQKKRGSTKEFKRLPSIFFRVGG